MKCEYDLGDGAKISFEHQSELPSDIELKLSKLVYGFGLSMDAIVSMIDGYPNPMGKELAARTFIGIFNAGLGTATENMMVTMNQINEARNKLN